RRSGSGSTSRRATTSTSPGTGSATGWSTRSRFVRRPPVLCEVGLPVVVPETGEGVGDVGMGGDRVVVELEAEAGGVGEEERAVTERVPAANQVVAPGDVELGEGFLDEEVRRTHVEMKAGRQRDGADRAVGGDAQVVDGGDGGD